MPEGFSPDFTGLVNSIISQQQDASFVPDYGIEKSYINILNTKLNTATLFQQKAMLGGGDDPLMGLGKSLDALKGNVDSYSPVSFDPVGERFSRYAGSSHAKDLGFLAHENNEERYAAAQGTWEKIGNGLSGAWELTKYQFMDQLEGWGRLTDAVFSGDLTKIYDQGDVEEVSQKMEQIMNDNAIFMSQADQDSTFNWSKFSNIVQQSGFTFGALSEIVAEEIVLSAITALTGGAGATMQAARTGQLASTLGRVLKRGLQLEETMADASKLRKVFHLTNRMVNPLYGTTSVLSKGLRGGETAASFARRGFGAFYRDVREANAAFTEARAEASGTHEELRSSLLEEYYTSGKPVSISELNRIDKLADAGTEANFWANSAIISASNKLQFENVFRGVRGASNLLQNSGRIGNVGGTFFARGMNLKTLREGITKRPLSYFSRNITEALQENLQNVSNKAVHSYYKARYNNDSSYKMTNALRSAINSQFSQEGLDTFLAGFLTGAITSPVSNSISSIYKRIGTTAKERADQKAGAAKRVETLNGLFSGPHGKNMTIQTEIGKAMAEATKRGDRKGFYDMRNSAIQELARTAIESGQGDVIFDRLVSVAKGLSDEEFKLAYGIDVSATNKRAATEYISGLRNRVEKIKVLKEDIDFKFPNSFRKEGKTPIELLENLQNYHAFEEAKWHLLYMKDGHQDVLGRQNGLLSEMRDSMSTVDYPSLFALTDAKQVKEEIKRLRQEAALSTGKEAAGRNKKANLLEAMLPTIGGYLDQTTFTEYINHIQKEQGLPAISQDVINENVERINDLWQLEEDSKEIFKNLNYLIDPQGFSRFVESHIEAFKQQEAKVASPITGDQQDDQVADQYIKAINDLRKTKYAEYAFPLQEGLKDGEFYVVDANGKEVPKEVFDQIKADEAAIESQFYPKEEQTGSEDEKEQKEIKIRERLAAIYQGIVNSNTIDPQDLEFLKEPEVVELGQNDPNYIKIQQWLSEPREEQEEKTEEQEEVETFTTEEEIDENNVVYDAVAAQKEEKQDRDDPSPMEVGTIMDERGVIKDGEQTVSETHFWVRGSIIRAFASNPQRFKDYEFVIIQDDPQWYKHASEGFTDQLNPYDGKGPYSYFKKKGALPGTVVLMRNKKTGEPLYFNPNIKGGITDSKNGLIGVFSLPNNIDKESLREKIKQEGEYVIPSSEVVASKGYLPANKGVLRTLGEFFSGTDQLSNKWEFHIHTGLKDEVWDFEEQIRYGGTYVESPGLNPIKLLPQQLSKLTINGKPVNIRSYLTVYDSEEQAESVVKFLKTIIYNGPIKEADHFKWYHITQKGGRVILKKLVSAPGTLSSRTQFQAVKMTQDSVLAELLSGIRMNVSKDIEQTVSIPILEGGKLVRTEDVSYSDILNQNLFTDKMRVVTPDGKKIISTINNRFVFPGLKEKLGLKKVTKKKVEEVLEDEEVDPIKDATNTAQYFKNLVPKIIPLYQEGKTNKEIATALAAQLSDVNMLVKELERAGLKKNAPTEKKAPAPKKEKKKTAVAKPKVEEVKQELKEEKKQSNSSVQQLLNRKKRFKAKDTGEDNTKLTREKFIQGVQQSLVGNEELQFVKDTFGEHVLNHMAYAVNSTYWAYWQNGVITLYSDAVSGTGYHEAWHHFSQTYLTVEQKLDLYAEVSKKHPELTDFKQVEEHLADQFIKFKNGEQVEAVQKNIFQKIWDFLVHLFTGKKTLSDYYNDLSQSNLYSYTPTLDNALWGRLNYGYVKEGKELLDTKGLQKAKHFLYTMINRSLSGENGSTLKENNITIAALLSPSLTEERRNNYISQILSDVEDQIQNFIEENEQVLTDNEAGLEVVAIVDENLEDLLKQSLADLKIETDSFERYEEVESEEDRELSEDLEEQSDDSSTIKQLEDAVEESISSDRLGTPEDKGILATMSKYMRSVLSTIPKAVVIDGQIEEYRNEFGLPERADMHRMMVILQEELSGFFKDHELLDKLYNDENLLQRLPEVAFIRKALPDFQKLNDPEFKGTGDSFIQALSSLMRDFNRIELPVYTLLDINAIGEEKRTILKEETKSTARKVKALWKDNFLSGDNVITDEKLNRQQLDPKFMENYGRLVPYVKNNAEATLDNRIEFLSQLGIRFSDRTMDQPELHKVLRSSDFQHFADTLTSRLKLGQPIEDPATDLMLKFKASKGESKFISNLINIESRFSDITPSNIFKTAKGHKKFGYTLPSEFATVGWMLKKAETLADLPAEVQHLTDPTNYYSRSSLVMNSLFDVEGDKQTDFIYGDYNGSVQRVNEKRIEKGTTELTGREKVLMDINALMRHGIIDIPRTGSSESSYFYHLKEYHHRYNLVEGDGVNQKTDRLPFPIGFYHNGSPGPMMNRMVRAYFFNLLVDEMSHMKFSKFPGVKGKEDLKRLKGWGVFDSILSSEVKAELISAAAGVKTPEDLKAALYPKTEIVVKEVDLFLAGQTSEFIDYLQSFGIDANKEGYPDVIDSRIVEEATDKGMEFDEVIRLYLLNAFVLNIEFSRVVSGIPQLYKDFFKRAKGIISSGNTPNNGKLVRSYLEKTHSRTMAAALGKTFDPNVQRIRKETLKDDMAVINKGLATSWKKAGVPSSIIKQYQQPFTVNDGQAYITLDAYRRLRLQMGNWDISTDEKQYQKEVAIYRLQHDLFDSQEEAEALREVAQDPQSYSTFPVAKFQYSGPTVSKGVSKKVLDKFSLAPLIPSVYHDTNLGDMNSQLLQKGTDYVTAESGTKVYTDDPLSLWEDGNRENFSISFERPATEVFSLFMKEQIKTESKVKPSATWGTQLRSLFLSNAFNDGKASDQIEELFDKYIGNLDDFIELERESLFKKFGIVEDEAGNITIENVQPFVETLQKQVEIRNLNDNIKSSIGYDSRTGKFTLPLEINTNRQAIIDLIGGMIYKKLVAIKANGDMLIQVASTGSRRRIDGILEPELPFYEPVFDAAGKFVQVKPAGCKVGFSRQYYPLLNLTHPDGTAVDNLERLNDALRSEQWVEQHSREITLVGYRIPTQEINSMEVYHIKEFLPEVFGSCVIVPKEMVVKSGSDFDIDKLSIFRPYYSTRGTIARWEGDTDTLNQAITNAFERVAEVSKYIKGKKVTFTPTQAMVMARESVKVFRSLIKDAIQKDVTKRAGRPATDKFIVAEGEVYKLTASEQKLIEDRVRQARQLETVADYLEMEINILSGEVDGGIPSPSQLTKMEELMANHDEVVEMMDEVREEFETFIQKTERSNTRTAINEKVDEVLAGSNEYAEVKNLLHLRNNFAKVKTNHIVDSYVEHLTSPAAFLQLITPNSTNVITPIAADMSQRLGLKGFVKGKAANYKLTEILTYKSSHVKFIQNLQGRKDLGVWALANKMIQLFQQAGTRMAETFKYTYDMGRKESSFKPTPWLLPASKREHGYKLGETADINGRPKQVIASQLINATVDIEKDPFYIALGINSYNKGVVVLLLVQGVPFENIISFIQQPVLRQYYSMMDSEPWVRSYDNDEGVGPTISAANRHAQTILRTSNREKLEKLIASVQDHSMEKAEEWNYEEMFSKAFMDKHLLSDVVNEKGNLYRRSVAHLGHFMALKRMSDAYRKLQEVSTPDTRKYTTPISAERIDILIEEVKYSGIVTEDSLDRLLNKSYTSPFTMKEPLKQVVETVMPDGFPKEFVKAAAQFMSTLYGTKDKMLKVEKTLSNDFITYIILNFGKHSSGPLLKEYGNSLIMKGNSLAQQYLNLIKEKKMQKLFSFFTLGQLLHTDISRKAPGVQNMEILRGMDDSTELQNVLIEDFRKLVSFNGKGVPGVSFTKAEIKTIQDFFKDLALLGIAQSGFNKSKLYFTDILPEGYINPILAQSLAQYQKEVKDKAAFVDQFIEAFKKNNAALMDMPSLKEAWRGKYLKSTSVDKNDELIENKELIKKKDNTLEEQTSSPAFQKYMELSLGIPIFEKANLVNKEGTPAAAMRLNNQIFVDPEVMRQKYEDKAWTQSRTLTDGSSSTPLAKTKFRSYESFERFVIAHETAHTYMRPLSNESRGSYEDRINREATDRLRYFGSPEKFDQVMFNLPHIFKQTTAFDRKDERSYADFKRKAEQAVDFLRSSNPEISRETLEEKLKCL